MALRTLAILLGAALLAAPARAEAAGEASPGFADYPAGPPFVGRGRLVLRPADQSFRTRLREAARGPANFAGHYALAVWGCGTECVMGAAVDLRSGRVTWLPGTVCCWFSGEQAQDIEPVRFRRDSSLVILNGMRNEREGDLGQHFYRMQGGRFVHLADRPPAATSGTATGAEAPAP